MEFPEAWARWLDLLQWPAMVVTITASWLVASQQPHRREWGFWVFLVSNAMWIVWGVHDGAWALVVLQVALALLNIRGVRKNER
jgi:hypothetical protein